jgi:hypothetical protein
MVPRPRPKMMVIGDSLAQGCRSLSVTGSCRTVCECVLVQPEVDFCIRFVNECWGAHNMGRNHIEVVAGEPLLPAFCWSLAG